ncbi:hypothetical protein KUM39_26320 [Streptomyces sp. J2-1]|uniref:hypothetical protein n=1 Tax=Streptomyces corallincola TaxID=2851888 RepID=UPI001C38E84F|nr:hypothetical protein [Streptomyces corallincola]MBV2357830.1 hypothetical protein [Streptomyces corallincola]
MRIRATVAAVTGALALSALAIPAAQAAPATGTPYTLKASFSGLKTSSTVKIGAVAKVSTSYSFTLTHDAGVKISAKDFYTDAYLYRGSLDDPSAELYGDNPATCTATSSTVATCKGTIDLQPHAAADADQKLLNSYTGSWSVGAEAIAFNGQDLDDPDLSKVGYVEHGGMATVTLQKYAKLTADASPEPVKKGKTLTVTGKLTRADWQNGTYTAYASQPVKLQFRKKGSSTYTTLKTVTTSSTGALKTTVTATQDGYYRYSFAGTSTTVAENATDDYVDVQ